MTRLAVELADVGSEVLAAAVGGPAAPVSRFGSPGPDTARRDRRPGRCRYRLPAGPGSRYRRTRRALLSGAIRNRRALTPAEFRFWADPFTAYVTVKYDGGGPYAGTVDQSVTAVAALAAVELADLDAAMAVRAVELADRRPVELAEQGRESRAIGGPVRGPDGRECARGGRPRAARLIPCARGREVPAM